MPLSILELSRARETVARILEEMGLEAFLFEIEPRSGAWELKVECAIDSEGGWETLTLVVPAELLGAAASGEPQAYGQLLSQWKGQLAACRRHET
jgi:hypothetical protein